MVKNGAVAQASPSLDQCRTTDRVFELATALVKRYSDPSWPKILLGRKWE
jgi:hypothetical protein